MKIEFYARKDTDGHLEIILSSVPVKGSGGDGTALLNYAKNCLSSISNVTPKRDQKERIDIETEIREIIKK